jgi:hypothetical protein
MVEAAWTGTVRRAGRDVAMKRVIPWVEFDLSMREKSVVRFLFVPLQYAITSGLRPSGTMWIVAVSG